MDVLDSDTRRESDVESLSVADRNHKATTTRVKPMSSTVQVQRKTVQDRDVISFRKEYGSEEHEVFAPTDQATQLLLSLLSVVNEGKENEQEMFVLARKGDLANGDNGVASDEMVKEVVIESVVRELYDDTAADAVSSILHTGGEA